MVDKSNKYDRQLRLWASTGQSNLEQSHICLINATTTGSEILKNLILPGIGSFTIIDSNNVSEDHLSGNFFLTKQSIGKPIAQEMSSLLNELNEDSKGHAIISIPELTDAIWDSFSLVIISDYIDPEFLIGLKSMLFEKGIPILLTNVVGFYGTLNLIANEVTVIETHSSSKLYDLRIDQPWPELLKYADSFDIESLDDTDHAHVPYVVIFIKALRVWKSQHEGHPPLNYSEKKQFKAFIESLSRNINFETNFIEASNSIHRALQETKLPGYLTHLFQHERIKHLNINTPLFWILIATLKNFVKSNNHQLPLPGNLPDMASDTTNYITLQELYRAKALRDKKLFIEELMTLLNSLGRYEPLTSSELEIINIFVKNCQFLHVANGTGNLSSDELVSTLLKNHQEHDNEEYNLLAVYYGMFTFNNYIKIYGKVPGKSDVEKFIEVFTHSFNINTTLAPSIIKTFEEICCHNSSSYHNISSFIGGIAAQEALKLITSQYVPLDNVFIFDGVRSVSNKYRI